MPGNESAPPCDAVMASWRRCATYQLDRNRASRVWEPSRGVMKIPTEGFEKAESITKPIQGTAGIGYQTIESLKGVQHLDKYDKDRALLLVRNDAGQLNLQTVELP